MSELIPRLINVSLRGGTLICKFLLIFFLAKFLPPEEVGIFGLVVATIGYSFFVIGFEFYTYSNRDLLGAAREEWFPIIRDQWIFFAISYVLFLPMLMFAFSSYFSSHEYLGWFLVLLFFEHTAQELNRLLVVMSEQFLASVVLFVRSGAWAVFAIVLMGSLQGTRNLDFVFLAWSIGAGAACTLGLVRIFQLDKRMWKRKVNWRWIVRGVKVAFPLLIASLAIRGLFTFDRYWVESAVGLDILGAYVLFVGIAFSIVSFLDAGVIAFLYPKVVSAAKENNETKFEKNMKELAVTLVLATIAMAAFALFFSPLVLGWIGKDIYIENLYLLQWLLLAVVIYAVSMVPHVGLYARHQDKAILYSQVLGLIVFFIGCFVGVPIFGVIAVVWAMCLSFFVILVWKIAVYKKSCGFSGA
jgi:O-antigen/teichoic acid export membrane protein